MAVEELNQYELIQASRMAHPHALRYKDEYKDSGEEQYYRFNPWAKEVRRREILENSPITKDVAQAVLRLCERGRLPLWAIAQLDVDAIRIIAEG